MSLRVTEGSPAHVSLRWAAWCAAAVVLVAVPLLAPSLRLHLAWEAATWSVAVLGLNLVTGYAGQISLGHAAFVGVGAYTTVILAADHHWPLLATVPAAGVVAFVIGFAVGVPALRFRGLYLALLTLAIGTAFGPVVKRLDSLTNGTNGKGTDERLLPPAWFGRTRHAERLWLYVVIVAVTVAVFVAVSNMVRGRVGRALVALRHDELSAQTFGINVRLMKMTAFGLSAGVTGVAGALLMLPSPFATDTRFSQSLSFQLYTAVFIGGIGTISGCVVGGCVIALLPFVTTSLGLSIDAALLYGAALVAVTLFFPDGIMGWWGKQRGRLLTVVPVVPAPLPDDEGDDDVSLELDLPAR